VIGEITLTIICDDIEDVIGAIADIKDITDEPAVIIKDIKYKGKSWDLD